MRLRNAEWKCKKKLGYTKFWLDQPWIWHDIFLSRSRTGQPKIWQHMSNPRLTRPGFDTPWQIQSCARFKKRPSFMTMASQTSRLLTCQMLVGLSCCSWNAFCRMLWISGCRFVIFNVFFVVEARLSRKIRFLTLAKWRFARQVMSYLGTSTIISDFISPNNTQCLTALPFRSRAIASSEEW